MKIFKRAVCTVLVVMLCFTSCLPVNALNETNMRASRPALTSVDEYKKMLWDEGFPVFTTAQYLQIVYAFSSAVNFLKGNGYTPTDRFEVTVDDFVTDACNSIYKECGLDIVALLTNLPATNNTAELITNVFAIDINTIRDEMYAIRDEYWEEGNEVLSSVYFFLGAYLSIMDKCEVYAAPTDKPSVYEVQLKVTYRNGEHDILCPGIFIDSETGECTGKDSTSGLIGIGFNFNLKEMMVYATINAWMRDFGFCVFYDLAANSMPLLWNYETRRFKFDYDGLEWMIQIWKGNYLITNGAEVGVYNRSPEKIGTFYDCATDDQLMEMSLQVYHGEELLVNQEPQLHWWINGFGMHERRYIPASLTMKFSILMPDEEMLNAFCESIDRHYRRDVSYTVDGLRINVVW